MVNDKEWSWANEYGRDQLLRKELEAQTEALATSRKRQQRDTSKLRSELRTMQGSLEALTNAFVAFVELDGIRKQLTAFPQHAEARRYAFQDLQVLLDGGIPPQRPDVDGYWLPPAMAALRPDGSVDPEQAALARQRDPHTAPVFLATAQAAFGAGETVVAELPKLLTPDDQGTWAEWQLLLWDATLRGAFGPAALTTLTATFRPLITSADDWLAWARAQADTNDTTALDWVASQLEEFTPRPTPKQETDWTATRTGRPDFVIRGSGRFRDTSSRPELELEPEPEPELEPEPEPELEPEPEPEPEPELEPELEPEPEPELEPEPEPEPELEPEETPMTVEETSPEENAWESTRAMLVRVMQVHINGGSESEHELLARAELLEEQFTNPLGASKLPDEVPEKRRIVIDALRQTALDDHAGRKNRRSLWLLIAEAFTPVAREWQTEPEPRLPEEKVSGYESLTVGPQGIQDQTAMRTLMRRYDSQQPTGLILRGREIMWAGAALTAASIALLLATRSNWFLLLGLAGIVAAVLGYKLNETAVERRNTLEASKDSLTKRIEDATKTAAATYEKAKAEHEERQASASRFLTTLRSSS